MYLWSFPCDTYFKQCYTETLKNLVRVRGDMRCLKHQLHPFRKAISHYHIAHIHRLRILTVESVLGHLAVVYGDEDNSSLHNLGVAIETLAVGRRHFGIHKWLISRTRLSPSRF